MRLASLILPTLDNNGESLADVHAALRADLIDHWGGYTATLTSGAYRFDAGNIIAEKSIRYDVAMEATADNYIKLVSIARHVCALASQESVMIIGAYRQDVSFIRAKAYDFSALPYPAKPFYPLAAQLRAAGDASHAYA